jgi:hypothetical protein
MDSGSSKGVGMISASRPLGPSGEAWRELLLVKICVVCGDMMGDGCCELEATEEVLIAETGTVEAGMVGSNEVWT